MKGPKPSMTMERLSKAPPVNRFKRPKNWLPAKNSLILSASMPGMGILAIILNRAKMAKTKRILLRRSFSLKIWIIL